MQAKLITSFKRLSETELLALVGLIIASLTGNARFPEPWPAPAPSLALLMAAYEAYRAAYHASIARDLVRIGERNAAREVLVGMLQQLVQYLEFVAHGDEAALQSTGFELRRDPVRIDRSEPPLAPEGLRLKHGALSGQLDVRVSRVDGAGSYEVQATQGDPNEEASWRQVLISTTCSRMLLRDLPPLKTFWVRVRGIGTQGFGRWSVPSSIVVL